MSFHWAEDTTETSTLSALIFVGEVPELFHVLISFNREKLHADHSRVPS